MPHMVLKQVTTTHQPLPLDKGARRTVGEHVDEWLIAKALEWQNSKRGSEGETRPQSIEVHIEDHEWHVMAMAAHLDSEAGETRRAHDDTIPVKNEGIPPKRSLGDMPVNLPKRLTVETDGTTKTVYLPRFSRSQLVEALSIGIAELVHRGSLSIHDITV